LSAGNFSASCITPAPLTIPATATFLVNNGTAVQALASGNLDDGGWSGIPLGFNFDFFGTNYTTLNVGTNGVLQFGAFNGTALADFMIGALPNTVDPLGAIYACANDLQCGAAGTPATYIRYWTEGYAPNRRFVIEYNVFQYGSTTNRVNVQVVLYETLGMVDVIAKQIMSTNSKSIGVNSPTGTIGAAAPNCTTNAQNYWSAQTATIGAANPQAWRFAPPSNYNVVWSENGTQFASGLNIFTQSVSPAITTLYSIIYTNTTTGCSNPANSATVNMTIGIDPGATLANGVSGNYMACPTTPITYTMANSTNAPGLTFQWFNLSGAISGATNNTYATTMVGYDEVYCEATCSGGSTYQSGLVVVDMNSFINCYCQPIMFASNPCSWIDAITTTGAAVDIATAVNAGFGGTGNSFYPSTGLSVSAGNSFNLNVQAAGTCNIAYFSVWIDLNQNGIFESSELMVNNISTGNTATTFSIAVPGSALSGTTRMRVIDWANGAAPGPCDNLSGWYGETEDYLINIIPLPATPMAPSEVGVPNCITGGTLSSNGAAPAGETWYWQNTATGTSTAQPVSSNLTIISNGTYYVRSQNNTYLTWSAASASITVIDFPAGPADPVTAAQGGNPACGSVTLLSSPALTGSTNYWQGTNAVGTSTSIVADNGISNYPYTATTNATYYIRAQDDITQCWSNPVATPVTIYALPTAPVLNATPGTICPGSTSGLTAVAPSAPPAGYSVSAIPYAPVSPISTTLAGAGPTGDEGTVVAPLGFSFNYYGTTYSDVQIHTNGYIVFGTNNYVFGSYTPPAIPSTAASNNWVGYWSDMNASAGQITYATQGTAPNRVFIANYNQNQYFSATPYYSGQIVVYEATGAIDVFLEHTQTTYTSACGMENQTGTLGTAAPGRNSGSWAATNEAWHFAPIQLFGFMWSPNGAGSGINAGDETLANISVTPSATTLYTMTITDPAYGCQNASSINVAVVPIPPAPTAIGASTPCGASTVTLTATGTGGTLRWYSAPIGGTILATGSSYTTPLINATTTYYVEEFNGACSGTRTAVDATYTPSPVATATSNLAFVCAGGSATLTASSSNATYAYTWEPGTLTGASVTVNPLVTTTYTVTAVDGPCVNVATVTVLAGANPNILSVTATPSTMCAGSTSQLFAAVLGGSGSTAPTYCSVTNSGSSCIESVSLNTLNSVPPACVSPYYNFNAPTGNNTTYLTPGATYTFSLVTSGASIASVWIDFNNNGVYEASEWSQVWTNASSGSITINVPMGATPGPTGMRVRSRLALNTNDANSACIFMGSGSTEDYVVTIVGGGGFNYSWTGSGLSSATAYNPTATPSATDTYVVTVADANTGCTSTGLVLLNVIQLAPAPSVTGGATACGVGPVVLSASGTGGTLNWYNSPTGGTWLNSGSTYTTTAISSTTTYYVDETVGACTGPRAAVVATFTPSPVVTASSNLAFVCAGGSATLTASSSNATYAYTWEPGTLTGASVTVNPLVTTTYTVTAVDGPCVNVATVTVMSGEYPNIVSVTATPNTMCAGATSQLFVSVMGGAGGAAPSYCTPTVGFAGVSGDYIESFTFNTISNLYSGDNPSDYATYPQTTTVIPGNTYPLTAAPGAAFGQGIGVWMDFNHNGSFADAGEFVFSSASGTATVSGNITIPSGATPGLTAIRVCAKYAATPASTESCGHTGFGEYEDYTMTIVDLNSFNYSWTGSGLSSTTTYNPTATPSATDTYTVTVTNGTTGCASTASVVLNVIQLAPAPSVTGGATACGVGPVVLSASGTGGILNWYNAPTGGTLVNTGSTYTTTAISSTTTYYVDETVGACTGPRAAVVATYTPSPVVTASSDVAYVCVGGANTTAVLTASSSNASYSYTWQPGGMTGASVTVTPTGTTTYTVTAVDGPCSNVATVTVNGPSVPVISSTTASPAVFCGGGTSQLQVNVVGGTSGLATGYCVPTATYGCNYDIISNVTFAGINNSTSCGGANQLYTSPNPSINAGGTYPLSVTTDSDIEGAAVWIDYNHSGTFDAGEEVLSGFAGTVPATYATSVTIPANAVGGQTLMRVRCTYQFNPTGNPCGTVFYGETEDYYVNIVPAASFNYSWSPAATLSSATAYNPSAAVSSTTAYTVTVSESTYGCSATSGVTVTVNPLSSSTTAITTCAPIVWNGTTYATTGAYTYTSQNAAGCDSVATLNLTIACSTVVNLTCLIQGYWDAGSSAMLPVLANQGEVSTATACDSIDVELRDITTYAMVQSVRTVLNQNGTANCVFPATSGDYYIVVKHRSAIQTWSALPVTVGPTAVSYNFTSAANQAYGDNQVEVSTGVWALYSGDIIIDENIDLLDLGTLELDISNFSYGYMPTDLNGDGNVDLLDSPVLEANISNFVFSYHP
jgi:hypothetical protein